MSASSSYAAEGATSWSTSGRTPDAPARPADLSGLSDSDLASLAARGRQGAFRELLARYERPVFSLVFRMVRDRTLAEDLAQESFIRAFNAIDSYKQSYKFSNWIFKIANNHTIDYLRRRKLDTISIHGSPHARTPDESERTGFTLEARGETPEQHVENLELGGQIEEAIGALRPEYRTVILLRHVEGHSYDEIARIMDLPLGTVKTYLHRARGELKDRLEPLQ